MKFSLAIPLVAAAALVSGHASPVSEPPRTIIGRDAPSSTDAAGSNQNNSNMVIVTNIVTVTASADNAQPTDANGGEGQADKSDVGKDMEESMGGIPAEGMTPANPQVVGAAPGPNSDTQEAQQPTADQQDQNGGIPAEGMTPANPQVVGAAPGPSGSSEEAAQTPQDQPTESTPQESQTIAESSASADGGSSQGSSGDTYTGDGTYYTPGLGSCGKTNTESDLIAAINAPQYGANANPNQAGVCGKCAQVKGPKGEVKVTITDRCPVCKSGDLDLSPAAFNKIGNPSDGRISISWSFVDC
ncbi:hypothetical protein LPJ78_004933 [Coemansia sp. RSA 989]|nr:hypothetical protein LPJ78_004933 [Coemansia sp. RSA 989]